jgi:hypothetical protein
VPNRLQNSRNGQLNARLSNKFKNFLNYFQKIFGSKKFSSIFFKISEFSSISSIFSSIPAFSYFATFDAYYFLAPEMIERDSFMLGSLKRDSFMCGSLKRDSFMRGSLQKHMCTLYFISLEAQANKNFR